MAADKRPIGVFDSGLGGLTAVKFMAQALPDERFVYFGDTARTPYGSKSVDTIKKFSTQIVDFLIKNDAKLIVIACNTVSATCLTFLRRKYPHVPIVGIIEPVVHYITENIPDDRRIGVIGTRSTVNSGKYEELIHFINEKYDIRSKACPLFVPVIEEGIYDNKIRKDVVRYYLDDFVLGEGITDLILGCTHYPLLEPIIEDMYGGVNIINPSEIMAGEVGKILDKKGMRSEPNDIVNCFYASDLSEGFKAMIGDIFPNENKEIEFKTFDTFGL